MVCSFAFNMTGCSIASLQIFWCMWKIRQLCPAASSSSILCLGLEPWQNHRLSFSSLDEMFLCYSSQEFVGGFVVGKNLPEPWKSESIISVLVRGIMSGCVPAWSMPRLLALASRHFFDLCILQRVWICFWWKLCQGVLPGWCLSIGRWGTPSFLCLFVAEFLKSSILAESPSYYYPWYWCAKACRIPPVSCSSIFKKHCVAKYSLKRVLRPRFLVRICCYFVRGKNAPVRSRQWFSSQDPLTNLISIF